MTIGRLLLLVHLTTSLDLPAEVDTRFGSGEDAGQLGQTAPMVGVPFAHTFLTPQTEPSHSEQKCWSPYYSQSDQRNITGISGVRATHWLSGSCVQDYGSGTVMPVTGPPGEVGTTPQQWQSAFRTSTEIARPDYYAVTLERYGVRLEATGTRACGVLKLSYPPGKSRYLMFQPNVEDQGYGLRANGTVTIDAAAGTIAASNPVHRIYTKNNAPAGFAGHMLLTVQRGGHVVDYGIIDGQNVHPNATHARGQVSAYVKISAGTEPVEISICNSFSSSAAAAANQQAELMSTSGSLFDRVASVAHQTWNNSLGSVLVPGAAAADRTVLYTAMYHSLLHPRSFGDSGTGRHPAFDRQTEAVDPTPTVPLRWAIDQYYTDYSMWDVFRGQLPWLSLVLPRRQYADMMLSLLDAAEDGGWLPVFPCWNSYLNEMVGDHAAAILADAVMGGMLNATVGHRALAFSLRNALQVPSATEVSDGKGRRATQVYQQYGYVPTDVSTGKDQQLSISLEYFYDDYVVSALADYLNASTPSSLLLKNRSTNWRQLLHPRTGTMRGKTSKGQWAAEPGGPFVAQKYTWFVPHDVPGLMAAMGGETEFVAKLDLLFNGSNFNAGNEPDIQAPYMYVFAKGYAWKTQETVARLRRTFYTPTPDGLPGNDDAGAMSAWYIMSALGFYPVCVGRGNFVIGSPLFKHVHMTIDGKSLDIKAPQVSATNIYVQSVRWNGVPYTRGWVTREMLRGGGTLWFEMGPKPNIEWPSEPPTTC